MSPIVMFDLNISFFFCSHRLAKTLTSVMAMCLLANTAMAQVPADSLATNFSDTLLSAVDTTFQDSLVLELPLVRLSKDSLEASVDYKAKDSMIYDIANQKLSL
ncbi:MAG: hypothetical protein HC912_00945 [Saprospiraceae bacterium]|nr:hypothetical protein [Saprospiraceae bacterium]